MIWNVSEGLYIAAMLRGLCQCSGALGAGGPCPGPDHDVALPCPTQADGASPGQCLGGGGASHPLMCAPPPPQGTASCRREHTKATCQTPWHQHPAGSAARRRDCEGCVWGGSLHVLLHGAPGPQGPPRRERRVSFSTTDVLLWRAGGGGEVSPRPRPPPAPLCKSNAGVRATVVVFSVKFWDLCVAFARGGGSRPQNSAGGGRDVLSSPRLFFFFAKCAYGHVTEELFVLTMLLCSLVPCSVQVSIRYLHPHSGG